MSSPVPEMASPLQLPLRRLPGLESGATAAKEGFS
jgi:hypothetical protein